MIDGGAALASVTLIAAGLYLLGLFLDASRDAAAKLLTVDLAVAQVVFYRVTFDVIFSLFGAITAGGLHLLWPRNPLVHLLKALAMGGAVYLIYTSLRYLPLAEVSGVLLMTPIFTMMLSRFFLGEHINRNSAVAIAFGLSGGLILLQPSSDRYTMIQLLPFAASASMAVATVCNRSLCMSNNNWAILFSAGLVISLATAPFAVLEWKPTDFWTTVLLLSLGLAGAIASYCHVHACRLAPVTFLAPLDYSEWVFAAALGWIIWADVPQLSVWLGCVCIVAGTAVALRSRLPATAGLS